MRRLAVISALILAGTALHAQDAPYALSARNKADIVRQVKDHLLDGDSAKWRWPLHQPEFGLYCGWVNAKNSYGAYIGWQPFMVIGGVGDAKGSTGEYKIIDPQIASADPDDTNAGVINSMCTRNGYDMSGPPPESPRQSATQ